MKRLRRHHRWAPWWFAAMVGLPYLALAYAVGLAVVDPAKGGEGIRIFLPLFAIFTYLALAVVCNMRTAVVTRSGVRVSLFPFPIGNGQRLKRSSIAICYSRHIVEYEDGVEIENFYTAGVETTWNQQIDVCIPLDSAALALQAAHDIGQVLNANPAEPRIPVGTVIRTPTDSTFKRVALVWASLFIVAVLAGAYWEAVSGKHF